jgi:hypothetical protein
LQQRLEAALPGCDQHSLRQALAALPRLLSGELRLTAAQSALIAQVRMSAGLKGSSS